METTTLRQWIAPLFVLSAVIVFAIQVAAQVH